MPATKTAKTPAIGDPVESIRALAIWVAITSDKSELIPARIASGSQINAIDQATVSEWALRTWDTAYPETFNLGALGDIESESEADVELDIGPGFAPYRAVFKVINTQDRMPIILGLPFLMKVNPHIVFSTGRIRPME